MVTIAGRLEDPLGNAIPDCQIELITQKNGSVVLVRTSATSSPDGAGNYSMNVQPGFYAVRLIADGCPPNYIGDIKIYSDAKSGTLNDFLLSLDESEITPALLAQVTDERQKAQDAAQAAQKSVTDASSTLADVVKKTGDTILAQVTDERQKAQDAALSAQNSATEVSSTLANVVKKSGDTMSGELNIKRIDPRLNLTDSRNENTTSIITHQTAFAIQAQNPNDSNLVTRLRYTKENEVWNFENSSVKINNQVAMKQGDYGFGATSINKIVDIVNSTGQMPTQIGYVPGEIEGSPVGNDFPIMHINCGVDRAWQLGLKNFGLKIPVHRVRDHGIWSSWYEYITSVNSTIDSNGFYKKASPICRLFGNDNITEVDGFKPAGCGLVNSEADGVIAKRIDVGHYEIHGSLGFAKEGWYITLPEDANGNKKIFAEYSTDDNNIITVKTFTRKFDTEQCEVVAGIPIDITAERWIDIRLEMPVNEVIEETNL